MRDHHRRRRPAQRAHRAVRAGRRGGQPRPPRQPPHDGRRGSHLRHPAPARGCAHRHLDVGRRGRPAGVRARERASGHVLRSRSPSAAVRRRSRRRRRRRRAHEGDRVRPFDEQDYEQRVVKPLRGHTGPLPDDLMVRYAVDPAMDAAELPPASAWCAPTGRGGHGWAGTPARCAPLSRRDDELQREPGPLCTTRGGGGAGGGTHGRSSEIDALADAAAAPPSRSSAWSRRHFGRPTPRTRPSAAPTLEGPHGGGLEPGGAGPVAARPRPAPGRGAHRAMAKPARAASRSCCTRAAPFGILDGFTPSGHVAELNAAAIAARPRSSSARRRPKVTAAAEEALRLLASPSPGAST